MQKILFSILIFLCSCSSNSGLGDLSAGTSEKQAMLNVRLEKYNKAVYWGSLNELVGYIEPQYQQEFFKNIGNRSEDEDLVESKIKSVSFYNNASKATAYIETRFFNKKSRYVNSRYEKLDWEFFRLDGGWRLKKIDELSQEHFAHLISE